MASMYWSLHGQGSSDPLNTNYEKQCIAVLKNEPDLIEGAEFLYWKHPALSDSAKGNFFKYDINNEVVTSHEVEKINTGGVRIQVVGHGEMGRDADGSLKTTMSGFSGPELANTLTKLVEVPTDPKSHATIKRVSLAGCKLAPEPTKRGTSYNRARETFLNDLCTTFHNSRVWTIVNARSELVGISPTGQKMVGKQGKDGIDWIAKEGFEQNYKYRAYINPKNLKFMLTDNVGQGKNTKDPNVVNDQDMESGILTNEFYANGALLHMVDGESHSIVESRRLKDTDVTYDLLNEATKTIDDSLHPPPSATTEEVIIRDYNMRAGGRSSYWTREVKKITGTPVDFMNELKRRAEAYPDWQWNHASASGDQDFIYNKIAAELQEIKEQFPDKEVEIDLGSIEVKDNEVSFDVVYAYPLSDGRVQKKVSVEEEELLSKRKLDEFHERTKTLSEGGALQEVNKGLSIYGTVMGLKGSIQALQKGDIPHGMVALSQSLHGIGELTGVNRKVYSAGKKLLGNVLDKGVKSLESTVVEGVSSELNQALVISSHSSNTGVIIKKLLSDDPHYLHLQLVDKDGVVLQMPTNRNNLELKVLYLDTSLTSNVHPDLTDKDLQDVEDVNLAEYWHTMIGNSQDNTIYAPEGSNSINGNFGSNTYMYVLHEDTTTNLHMSDEQQLIMINIRGEITADFGNDVKLYRKMTQERFATLNAMQVFDDKQVIQPHPDSFVWCSFENGSRYKLSSLCRSYHGGFLKR